MKGLRFLVETILNLKLGFLSWFVPKKKNLYVMGGGNGRYFQGNTKYFFLYLLRTRPGIDFVWITREPSVYDELKAKEYPVVKLSTVKGWWLLLRARFLLMEISSRDYSYEAALYGRFNKIQTCHGNDLKKISRDRHINKGLLRRIRNYFESREYKSYKLVVSLSDRSSEPLRTAFANDNIAVLGYPRNDVLFDPSYAQVDYKSKFQLDLYKKVHLYVPTFKQYGDVQRPFSKEGLAAFDKKLKERGEVLLVKKHIYSRQIEIDPDFTNIIDVSAGTKDIQELMPHCDLLISDYSSVWMDFLLLERPVVLFVYDFEEYSKTVGFYYDYLNDLPGPFARTEEELYTYILKEKAWWADPNYQVKYNAFNNLINRYHDSGSSARLLKHLQELTL